MSDDRPSEAISRRQFVRSVVRGAAAAGLAGTAGVLLWQAGRNRWVWQIDPDKCIGCGNCATYCVLGISAVKCSHAFAMCGYCKRCFGYFEPQADQFNTGGENQLCPTGAIERKYVEEPYYQYTINEELCIGCGKCIQGCKAFGNGSLFLQVRHDLCVNCNECAIAVACPSGAYVRIRADGLEDWLKRKGRTS